MAPLASVSRTVSPELPSDPVKGPTTFVIPWADFNRSGSDATTTMSPAGRRKPRGKVNSTPPFNCHPPMSSKIESALWISMNSISPVVSAVVFGWYITSENTRPVRRLVGPIGSRSRTNGTIVVDVVAPWSRNWAEATAFASPLQSANPTWTCAGSVTVAVPSCVQDFPSRPAKPVSTLPTRRRRSHVCG